MNKIFKELEKYITARNILLFFGTLFLVIIFFNLLKILSFTDTSFPLEKGEKEKIRTEIIQKFTAGRDGLARIEILFGGSDVSPGGTLYFKLKDEDCKKIVREEKINITSLGSDDTTNFIFPKIGDSKGKTYCLTIAYAQRKGGKKAEIFITEKTTPEKTFLSVNEEEIPGKSISIRPAYKNTNILEDIGELNKRISQYKPFFLKHYYLYFISFGFIILSIVLVAILILI